MSLEVRKDLEDVGVVFTEGEKADLVFLIRQEIMRYRLSEGNHQQNIDYFENLIKKVVEK